MGSVRPDTADESASSRTSTRTCYNFNHKTQKGSRTNLGLYNNQEDCGEPQRSEYSRQPRY